MGKKKETKEIEELLKADTAEKRIYGCEEVTIGFHCSGGGHEIVDFMTLDSKDTIKCYEIKVTISDLKSNAKKSFYGNYNYLVVTRELYQYIKDKNINLEMYGIPEYVGIMTPSDAFTTCNLSVRKKAKKQSISEEQSSMLKSSLARTLYYKMEKYRKISDCSLIKEEKKKANRYKNLYSEEKIYYQKCIDRFQKARRRILDAFGIYVELYPDSPSDEIFEEIKKIMCSTQKK